jgi:hypothetical protein
MLGTICRFPDKMVHCNSRNALNVAMNTLMTNERTEISRRKALQRVAMVGAAAWTAPMIVSTTAHAAGSLADNICPGRPKTLTLKYVGGPWVKDACVDPALGPNAGTISAPPPTSPPPCIDVYADIVSGGNATGGQTTSSVTVYAGAPFTVDTKKGGSELTIKFAARKSAGSTEPTVILGRANLHVSCSQALCVGDKYGYFQIVGFTK